MKTGDIVYVTKPQPSFFSGHIGKVEVVERNWFEEAWVLVQFGPELYNYDLWLLESHIRLATEAEILSWNGPVTADAS